MRWFLLLFLPFSLFAKLSGNRDFQIWNTDSLRIRISKNLTLTGEGEFRYGDNRKTLYYKHYQGGLLFNRSPHTLLYLAHREIFSRVNNKWEREHTPLVDLTFQIGNARGLYLGNRNRIEYRILSEALGGNNRWVYRNRTEYIPPIRLSWKNIAPFFAYELFWQETRGLDQHRLQAGLKIPYHKRTQLALSYLFRTFKNSQKAWIHHNILWINFSLHF